MAKLIRQWGDILFFNQATRLIALAQKNKFLRIKDLLDLPEKSDPRRSAGLDPLDRRGPWRLIYGVLWGERRRMFVIWAMALTLLAFELATPQLIFTLLTYVKKALTGDVGIFYGVLMAILLAICSLFRAFIQQHMMFWALTSRQVIVNGLNYRIYQHALRLTPNKTSKTTVGTMVNHLGTDTDGISFIFYVTSELFYSLIAFIGIFFMIYHYLGAATYAILLVLAIIAPLIKITGKSFVSIEQKLLEQRDLRVNLITQILNGIRIIKYHAWERAIEQQVGVIRGKEIRERRRWAIAVSLSVLVFISTHLLVPIVGFGTYMVLGGELDIPMAFACLALFEMLVHPFGNLTNLIAATIEAKVSAQRIIGFLADGTLDAEPSDTRFSEGNLPLGVAVRDVSFRYDANEDWTLAHINLVINPGESVAIVGPVGSGKSTLVQLILNEMKPEVGSIEFSQLTAAERPRIGYVPQTPFILNNTIRNNILFGEVNQDSLNDVLYYAAFDDDIRCMDAGIDTEIGEHGINLSGGQKQRLSIARAICFAPGVALLDDPLSAVDVHTEECLVERLLFGHWQKITRIVVTHRLTHLARFDRIVFMVDGKIRATGSLAELLRTSPAFAEFQKQHLEIDAEHRFAKILKNVEQGARKASPFLDERSALNITVEEDRGLGSIKKSVVMKYLQAMCYGKRPRLVFFALLASILLAAALPLVQNIWLAMWLGSGKAAEPGSTLLGSWLNKLNIGNELGVFVYCSIGLFTIIAIFYQFLLWRLKAVGAGRILHEKAFSRVLHLPVLFFDQNPIGRIINRFSSDIDTIEGELTWSFQETVGNVCRTLASMLVIFVILPVALLVFAPLSWLFMRLQTAYRRAARDLRRLYAISRSPRFAHFKETLEGLPHIRAYGQEHLFLEKFYRTLHEHQTVFYNMVYANRWFAIRIPLMSSVISLFVTISIIIFARYQWITPALAGLLLLYGMNFWMELSWTVRQFSTAESNLTAVERVAHYSQLTPERDILAAVALPVSASWPLEGKLQFSGVKLRYDAHLPLVLKGVDLTIRPRAKVGIVGKTGSGKSTLLKAMFRFVNLSGGAILIDGVDINSIPLERLRSALAIIPQDPVLFKGTVRSNLDPFGLYATERIHQVLVETELLALVAALPHGIDSLVEDEGSNFSHGERQLFCLARALLHEVKIIVLDEPTASVDVKTDALIQQTLLKSCKEKTVIIVAHRLGTLRDCDFIVEMDEGQITQRINREDLPRSSDWAKDFKGHEDFSICRGES